MRRARLAVVCGVLSCCVAMENANAAAFQLYELGTPVVGTAEVGQAAVASDASTAYFNPAGMQKLNTTQFMLGSEFMLPYTNFSRSTRTTYTGDNGGNAANLVPGLDLYYVYRATDKLRMGVSLTTPYVGALNYEDGWVGRYFVQNIQFYTINLNPSISYQWNEWLAFGLGAAVEYANLQETVALPSSTPGVDGQINLKLDNYAPGFNAGVLVQPRPSTKLGLAFRSRISHSLHGDVTYLRIGAKPSASTSMVMPQNLIISAEQGLSERWTLLGELGWSHWSSMQNTVLHVAGYSATVPLNWNDTYRFGVGSQYKMTSALKWQVGASYDSSPTVSSYRLPDLPMDRQIRLATGLIYSVVKPVTLAVSYEYIDFGRANINNQSSLGRLVGSYSRNYGNVVQVSANVDC